MTEKVPRVTAAEVIKAIEKAGFYLARQSGSHKVYKNKAGKRITISFHAGKILHPNVLLSILMDADLSVNEFKKLLGK